MYKILTTYCHAELVSASQIITKINSGQHKKYGSKLKQ